MLLEREVEMGRLDALLAGARAGRGGVVAVEGPAGIGKTRLLEQAAGLADGLTVLTARGSELERGFGFGVVRTLLEAEVVRSDRRRRSALLDGAAALAAPALGLPGEAPQGGETRYAVLHGLYWLVANLAAERPLLLVVDDLQWADDPSLRFLAYLARRLGDLPVALLVALRPALPGDERTAIDAIVEGAVLEPAPLTEAAVATLAADRLGAEPDREFVDACHQATGGNALLVEELLEELREAGRAPDVAAAAGLEAAGAERVGRRVARRIAALGGGAGALAEAVAVLGDDCELTAAAALARLEPDAATAAASALAAADILAGLSFRHPLVRAAVVERIPAVDLAGAHGRAARLLAERGAPPAALAPHLLAAPAGGDPWVVETLREAARGSVAQGTPELAVSALRRALAEPPPDRAGLLQELGRAEHVAGLPEAAGRFHEAIAVSADPVARARLGLELAGALSEQARWGEAAAAARAALADLGDADRELGLLLQALLADCVRMDPTVAGDEPEALRRLAATLSGDTPAERWAIAAAASMTPADSADEHARAAALVQRSVADGGAAPGFPMTGVVSNLIRACRLDAAERVIEDTIDDARRHGYVRRYATMLSMRGWVALERGALADAAEDLAAALELAADVRSPQPAAAVMLALVRVEQGGPDEADALLDGHGLAGELPEHQVMNVVLHYRSRVRLAQERRDDALADALAVGERYRALGLARAVPPWRSQAAVLAGSPELAEEEVALAERWGTPLARGLALRGLGLVTGSIDRLAAAVTELERSPARLELARARIDLGAALRRDGRRADAREPLALGMDAAHACGARRLAEHGRTELLATGARPRRLAIAGSDALTPSERRVAALAAEGLTNRRIAQQLFVTTATVETHLRHAFRKLGVRSRAELPGRLPG